MGGCRVFCSTNLLISASTDESNFSAPAEDDVGAFIRFSVTGLASSPNPGRYFHLVNNCLGTPHTSANSSFLGHGAKCAKMRSLKMRGASLCTGYHPLRSRSDRRALFSVHVAMFTVLSDKLGDVLAPLALTSRALNPQDV